MLQFSTGCPSNIIMPKLKKMPSDTLGSTGGKKKASGKKSVLRRAIEILIGGQDKSEGPQDVSALIREYLSLNSDKEWLSVVNSKNYREVNKRTLSGGTDGASDNPATQLLFVPAAEGRQSALTKDLPIGLSDVYFSGNPRASSPSQPVALLDKLKNGSSELAAHSGARTVAASKPVGRRKFFRSAPKEPVPGDIGLPGTVDRVCSGEPLTSSSYTKLGGKRGATSLTIKSRIDSKAGSVQFEEKNIDTLQRKGNTSEKIILSNSRLLNNESCGLMQLSNHTMKLDMRARPATPVQLNGIHRESRIRKEIWGARESAPGSDSKRKASPVKDRCVVKVRRLDRISEEPERDTQSFLLGDQSEKCEKIAAGVNKVQSSQNGPIINQYESDTDSVENTVLSERISFPGHFRRVMATLENAFKGHLPQNLMDSDSGSSPNCNSVGSTTVSDASRGVDCRRAPHAASHVLQPVVLLRKLTSDEIRHSTPKGLGQREESSHNCVEESESVDSSELSGEESVRSFRRKPCNKCRKGYRKCICRKRKSSNCILPFYGDRPNGRWSEQESPGRESEAGVCSRSDYTSVVRNGATNRPQNGESCHCSCNGVREYTGRSRVEEGDSEYGSDEASSNSGISSAETVEPDLSAAKTTLPYAVVGSDNRKCCSNGMCRVATPELIGLENPITSNRCWMNVTLQTLFSMDNFMQSMIKAFQDVNAEDNSLISTILTLHYARSLGHQECVYEQARKLSEVLGKLNSDYILNDQQDPSEFILWLFNVFEPALEKYGPSWASGLITENFRFEMEERTCCEGCMNYVVKISSFLILMLDIYIGTSKVRNIQEALAAYTSTKNIKRTCSLCREENSMVKTAFKSVPRYLIINLKRYSVKEGEVIRDETPVTHSHNLCLEKYSVPNSTINCSQDTRSVAVASPSKYNIGRKSLRVARGDYKLIAIIHHSGFSVSSGHYVCDVYHASTKKWYSYNDKMVKEICEATLSTTKRQKTGYIYVYQNKNC